MDPEALKQVWLQAEKEQEAFVGWDFSWLGGKSIYASRTRCAAALSAPAVSASWAFR